MSCHPSAPAGCVSRALNGEAPPSDDVPPSLKDSCMNSAQHWAGTHVRCRPSHQWKASGCYQLASPGDKKPDWSVLEGSTNHLPCFILDRYFYRAFRMLTARKRPFLKDGKTTQRRGIRGQKLAYLASLATSALCQGRAVTEEVNLHPLLPSYHYFPPVGATNDQ